MVKIVLAHPHVRQIHGFYLVRDQKKMRFDIVVSFAAADRRVVFRRCWLLFRKPSRTTSCRWPWIPTSRKNNRNEIRMSSMTSCFVLFNYSVDP
ncbi:MAG: hypothetical protein II704_07620 [Erysipelotrichaceae bacterium]|nr:hypothetical protein [Erysipelotrichaceae bacterium]